MSGAAASLGTAPYTTAPYAAVADMVARYGAADMTRLSTQEGQDQAGPYAPRIETALTEASGRIDTYLRRRYLVPVTTVTPELNAAACALARYSMSFGGGQEPSEQARLQQRDAVAWLEKIAAGEVTLDGVAAAGPNSFAQVSDRAPTFGAGPLAASSSSWPEGGDCGWPSWPGMYP